MRRVRTELTRGAALLILDDVERRNALGGAMVDELTAALSEFGERSDVGAIVITGEGSAFCAGADRADLAKAGNGDMSGVHRVYEVFVAVLNCPVPTIAAVNGPAVGAGLNLALACDVRIAAASARFDCRFLSLGLHPGGGSTWMLDRIAGPQAAAAMVLFGDILDGRQAADAGLAWRCVADSELRRTAQDMGQRAAGQPRDLLRTTKDTLRQARTFERHADAMSLEADRQRQSFLTPEAPARLHRGAPQ